MSALDHIGVARAEFFGRVKELHRLREALRSAIEERHRRAVILLGAPGIGKSRFDVPEMLAIAAALYLVISIAGDVFGAWLERRLRARGFGAVEGHAKGAHP